MDDVAAGLSEEEIAELCALADGTLPAERRAAVEARVAASPELQELLDRQRRALGATRAAAEPVPAALLADVEARVEGARRKRRPRGALRPRFALGGAAAAAAAALAAIVIVLVAGGGSSGPSVADAARLAMRPASLPAPARAPGSAGRLAAAVEGVAFPDLRRAYGWRPAGLRQGRVDGRAATVVYYRKGGRRIGYAIVAGPALPRPSGARALIRRGVEYRSLRVDGRPAITWQRVGRTCVITGAAPVRELLALAAWRGGSRLSY